MERPIKVLGLSDPIVGSTGFARVHRELFGRLADLEEYDLASMSRGWVGTRRWPRIKTYIGTSEFCQNEFPMVVHDFAADNPFILWTLMDPWQVGWISNYDGNNRLNTPASVAFWRQNRKRVKWIGHFPIDGYGPHEGPGLWVEQFMNGPDVTVFMSDFGRRVLEPYMTKPWRVIKHAIDVDVYKPYDKVEAKRQIEAMYEKALRRALSFVVDGEEPLTEERVEEEVAKKRLRLEGHFVILCVMANRERKFWPRVLEAFKAFREARPAAGARLVGLCGDRTADRGGYWPLVEYGQMLGLERQDDPIVWLIDALGRVPWEEDLTMASLNSAADLAVLISGGEGFGLPQLEAHACGTPCIVGRYSASEENAVDPREVVEPRGYVYAGTNMIRWPTYRVRDIVQRMVYAYDNEQWRREVGWKGVERAKEHDWKVILPQWLSLFEEVWDGDGAAEG